MLLHRYPDIWPFAVPRLRLHPQHEVPPHETPLAIAAILVFNDPRHWGPTLQLMLDLLLADRGRLGTYAPGNNGADWQAGAPDLIWSNPDLWWQASYALPRLGQGG